MGEEAFDLQDSMDACNVLYLMFPTTLKGLKMDF